MDPSHDTPGIATTPSGPPLAIIAAVAANGVIGAGNRLPWRLSDDLQRFRALTTGHAVIMGRRTWESIGRPLPGRQNIVVTHHAGSLPADIDAASSLEDALTRVRMPAPVFCIGGSGIYREALPLATTLHLTEIERAFAGDAYFPAIDRSAWRETARERRTHAGPDGFEYAFTTYVRAAA
jgi:dihydrofolate reductase